MTTTTPTARSIAGPADPRPRVADCLTTLAARLRATGGFAAIVGPGQVPSPAIVSELGPNLRVQLRDWSEQDDAPPATVLRRVRFKILIALRHVDRDEGFARLGRLADLVVDTLDGSDLGPGCLPELTRVRVARSEEPATDLWQRVALDGEFTLLRPRTAA